MASNLQLTPESLCDGLDQLSLQSLELMDELIKSNMMLESTMRGGYFYLGKTRYNMGNHAVSALQLPNEEREVDALATAVTTSTSLQGYDAGDLVYQQIDTTFEDPIITLHEEDTEETCDKMDTDDFSVGLRRRHQDGIEDLDESTEGNHPTDCNMTNVRTINRDPIRWFSALPPQTLRQAQTEFKTAIKLSTQCANLQLKLSSVNKEYKRLLKIKSKLERLEKEP